MKTYSENLRKCMAEIRELMKKYDCMGFVNLGDKDHGEFSLFIDTTWSRMRFEGDDGKQAHVRFMMKGVKVGTKEAADLDATVAFVCNSADLCNLMGQQFYAMKAQIAQHSDLTHEPLTRDRILNDDREGGKQ